jgi:dienelactone hydrolase
MDSLEPLVLPVELRAAERHGPVDLYLPDDVTRPQPAVLIVHGGPIPAGVRPTPRDWPAYQGYGSLVAYGGAVGAVVDHELHTPADYPAAEDDVRRALDLLRADSRVDGERIAIWFFSGGALLSAGWLGDPPAWLRCVALTYPVLTPPPGWDVAPRYRPVEAVANAGDLPIVLTRVGRENPDLAVGVQSFVDAAVKANLEIIDVPQGRHGFDTLDDDDDSRAAIRRAADAVLAAATR